jgi:elongation factor G
VNAPSAGAPTIERIRNIALLGHAGAGKTTLIEMLLAAAGAIRAAGSVEKGSTVCDFTAQERHLHHSLDAAVCHLTHHGRRLNLIDTPGYPDFLGRALAVLTAVESAAVVINAQHGVELITRRAMAVAAERRLCRVVVVNRIDAGVDLRRLLGEIRESFGPECLPLNLPARGGQAVADCFFAPTANTPDFSSVAAAHTEIVDQVVELDDRLMEVYLEQGEALSLEQLHDPFERALRAGHLVPVCFVSAKTGAGLPELMRVLTELMPNPLEGNPPQFAARREGRAVPLERTAAAGNSHFLGHVFKINVDPYVGRIAAVRVHEGGARVGQTVFIGDKRRPVKLAHLYSVQGKDLVPIAAVGPGDFCAVTKIDGIQFGDVLHSSHDEDEVLLAAIPLPAPMYGLALELKQRGQEQRLSDALHKLSAEDPSLTLEFNAQTNETVLRGMGELHLRMVLERVRGEFALDIATRPPRIAYRETVSRSAEGHHRHKKQTGGAGQFGEVHLRVEPLARGAGFEFVDEVVGGAIPKQFIPAVEKGVRELLAEGAVAGYPVTDVRVIVCDGKYHTVDSKEIAFVVAGKRAFKDAIHKAGPLLLEPIARLEISAPSQCVGDITGHLSAIRSSILGSDTLADSRAVVHAHAPLAELGEYQTRLKSLTGGAGVFTMEFHHYAVAPPELQNELREAFRPQASE